MSNDIIWEKWRGNKWVSVRTPSSDWIKNLLKRLPSRDKNGWQWYQVIGSNSAYYRCRQKKHWEKMINEI